jgi:hypothetical protein
VNEDETRPGAAMNATQIENVLQLIDRNIALTRTEAIEYIREHRNEIARTIAEQGTATIPTAAGDLKLSKSDLAAVAA